MLPARFLVLIAVGICSTRAAAQDISFQEKRLGAIPEGVRFTSYAIYSADGRSFVYVEEDGAFGSKDMRARVVINGNAGEWFRQVYLFESGVLPKGRVIYHAANKGDHSIMSERGRMAGLQEIKIGSLQYGADTGVYVFGGKEHGKYFVVINGKRSEPLDGYQEPTISPDGRTVGYAQKVGDRWSVVVDGKKGPDFASISSPTFSPDGKRVAYVAAGDDGKKFIVLDGEKQPGRYDQALLIEFSQDGRSLAHIAMTGDKYLIVKDGKPLGEYTQASGIKYSPVGKRFAYRINRGGRPSKWSKYIITGGKWHIVVDGKEGAGFDSAHSPVFSPDGQRISYRAEDEGKSFQIVDGKKVGLEFDWVGWLIFSPDCKSYVYLAKEGKTRFVVLDGKKVGGPFDNVAKVVFSPDSKKLAILGLKGREVWWKVVSVN